MKDTEIVIEAAKKEKEEKDYVKIIGELEEELKQKRISDEDAAKEKMQITSHLATIQMESEDRKRQIDDLTNMLNSSVSELGEIKRETYLLKQKLGEMAQLNEKTFNELQLKNSEIQNYELKQKEAQEKIGSLEALVNKKSAELEEASTMYKILQSIINDKQRKQCLILKSTKDLIIAVREMKKQILGDYLEQAKTFDYTKQIIIKLRDGNLNLEERLKLSNKSLEKQQTIYQDLFNCFSEEKGRFTKLEESNKKANIHIAYLKEQYMMLKKSAKMIFEAGKVQENQLKKTITKLENTIDAQNKEKQAHDEYLLKRINALEEEIRGFKENNLKLSKKCQETLNENQCLGRKNEMLETEKKDISGKENQASTQAIKYKKQTEVLQREIQRLESEKNELYLQNNLLSGHANINQKIHFHQKIKDENNMLREANAKLSEENKTIAEQMSRTNKDMHYLKAKYGVDDIDLVNLPSKYEFRIQELEEKLSKEIKLTQYLADLPEVAPIYSTKIQNAEPHDQILTAINYLVQTIRVTNL